MWVHGSPIYISVKVHHSYWVGGAYVHPAYVHPAFANNPTTHYNTISTSLASRYILSMISILYYWLPFWNTIKKLIIPSGASNVMYHAIPYQRTAIQHTTWRTCRRSVSWSSSSPGRIHLASKSASADDVVHLADVDSRAQPELVGAREAYS